MGDGLEVSTCWCVWWASVVGGLCGCSGAVGEFGSEGADVVFGACGECGVAFLSVNAFSAAVCGWWGHGVLCFFALRQDSNESLNYCPVFSAKSFSNLLVSTFCIITLPSLTSAV